MKRVDLWMIGIGLSFSVGLLTVAPGYAEEKDHVTECTLATLTGTYVFTATGYTITPSGPEPKAIVEMIDFDGEGTLTVPAVSRSLNGVILPNQVGLPGTYTVNENCTGTITFGEPGSGGPTFDIVIAPNGKECYMIQTNANNVLAGVSRRVSHTHEERDHEERDEHRR
jgi:hypothetical protein